MKLSSKARYAVMALTDLACDVSAPVSLSSIAERQHLPLSYLEQLFLKLRKAGLVTSHRGAMGGYILMRPASEICIQDIVEAVDRGLKATRCDIKTGGGCQPGGIKCVTHDLWEELGLVVSTFLSKVTLQHVCDGTVGGLGRFGFMEHSMFSLREVG